MVGFNRKMKADDEFSLGITLPAYRQKELSGETTLRIMLYKFKLIPDRLLSSRSCFRLGLTLQNYNYKSYKISKELVHKKRYFCKPKAGLKMFVNLLQYLTNKFSINCKLFSGRDNVLYFLLSCRNLR
jgi:hypothetical protein